MNLKDLFTRKSKVSDGIDFIPEKHIVSFNPNHQNNVDTNDLYNPHPFYSELDGHKVISVFERKHTEDEYDGNPLIYALKNYGKPPGKTSASKWRFANPNYDILALMRRFVAVTKEFDEPFDTIVCIESSSPLNRYIATCIHRIKGGDLIKKFFTKYDASYVQDFLLDEDEVLSHFPERERDGIREKLNTAFHNMRVSNGNKFSYKLLGDVRLRKYMPQSMEVPDNVALSDEISSKINDKRVLVVDDTITSHKTLSDSSKAILDTFYPKEIIFFTLFTALH